MSDLRSIKIFIDHQRVAEDVEKQLEIRRFISLKREENDNDNSDIIDKLEICTQSIVRWQKYCEYHYANLLETATKSNLRLDRISITYRQRGETVPVRYVYEANIAAFLNSLHALLDSFPYLLNLFINKQTDTESTSITWNEKFIKKYQDMAFYDELIDFLMDTTFNKVKGYVNTIKHKHLIRISNHFDHLEFEKYTYKQPCRNEQGKINFQPKIVAAENVVHFIEKCYNELIPKFFDLCEKVLDCKNAELSNHS